MKLIFDVIGALALIGGIVELVTALIATNTQYGTYYGVLAIAAFALARILFSSFKDDDKPT